MSAMASTSDMESLAQKLGLAYSETIDDARVDIGFLERLPLQFARETRCLPLGESDGKLLVATGDPSNLAVLDELRGHLASLWK